MKTNSPRSIQDAPRDWFCRPVFAVVVAAAAAAKAFWNPKVAFVVGNILPEVDWDRMADFVAERHRAADHQDRTDVALAAFHAFAGDRGTDCPHAAVEGCIPQDIALGLVVSVVALDLAVDIAAVVGIGEGIAAGNQGPAPG